MSSSAVLAVHSEDFSRIISGEAPLDNEMIDGMYAQFLSDFQGDVKTLPSSHYKRGEMTKSRREIYADNLRSIIKHNSDPTQTYKKGIN